MELWNNLSFLQAAAVVSALVLTVGAILEYRHQLKLIALLTAKWVCRKSTPLDRCVFRRLLVHSFGPILVVLGIAGEVVFEGRTFVVEDKQEEQARKIVGSLQDQERIASNEAEALKKRLDTASTEMSGIEKEIAAQGPRAKLLAKAAPDLAKKLAPFAGQRVALFVCGQQGLVDQETVDTWGAIANILDSDTVLGVAGAKWKEVPTNLNWAGNCGASKGLGQGVIVFVSKRASQRTMEAAKVLGYELAKTLPPSPNKMPSLIDPDFAKLQVDRGFEDKKAPWVSVGLDPDLITVLIGQHP